MQRVVMRGIFRGISSVLVTKTLCAVVVAVRTVVGQEEQGLPELSCKAYASKD